MYWDTFFRDPKDNIAFLETYYEFRQVDKTHSKKS